jgi:hypothetical protein
MVIFWLPMVRRTSSFFTWDLREKLVPRIHRITSRPDVNRFIVAKDFN